ncbi:hypothetical protein SLA2020_411230 [Shorea laevis]
MEMHFVSLRITVAVVLSCNFHGCFLFFALTGFDINDNTYTRNFLIVGFSPISMEDCEKKKYQQPSSRNRANLHLTVHGVRGWDADRVLFRL